MPAHGTTGDGIVTGLHLLAEMARSGQSLAALAARVTKLPQVLVNVSGVDRSGVDGSAVVQAALASAQTELGDGGRVLLRPSGTEPVIRVMVEAETQADAARISEQLATVVRDELAIP